MEAQRPERHVQERMRPERLSGAQLAICAAMVVVGLLLIAAGLFIAHAASILRVILISGGAVALLIGFLRALGAEHIGLTSSQEGVRLGADFPKAYTRTLDVSEGLTEGSMPAKEGMMPPKQGVIPPKRGEIPGASQPTAPDDGA